MADAAAHGRSTWTAADRHWAMVSRVGLAGALFHLGFLVVFAVAGTPVMAEVNAVSVVVYGVVSWAIRRRRRTLVLVLTMTELVAHAVIAVWALGWSSNFQYYVLLIIPFALQAEGARVRRALGVTVVAVAYLGMTARFGGAGPAVDVDPQLLAALRVANAAAFIALLCHLCLAYVRTVESAEARLRRAAEQDPMTGLLNRTSFLAAVGRRLAAGGGARPAVATWIVFVDIDHFKSINDRFGHAAGDRAIQRVSERIRRVVRPDDLVARWGGEEFLVLIRGVDQSTTLGVVERLRASLGDAVDGGHDLTVTVGIARHDHGSSIEATIARADGALYRGKQSGRDRVELAV